MRDRIQLARHHAPNETGTGDNPGPGVPSAAVDSIVSGSEGRSGASAALCRVMLQVAPSGFRRERLVKAVGLICIPRAKGRVRLRVFAASADPLDEQT